jgi:pimeloyl-ACP methyl ester carboxylesterase
MVAAGCGLEAALDRADRFEQIDFRDATAAFSGNAPWDLRPRAAEIAARQPTAWVLPAVSRFVPAEDQMRLGREVGERAVVVIPDVGHSVHRDAPEAFVDIVMQLGEDASRVIPAQGDAQ